MSVLLVDTGPLVAILDQDDADHQRCLKVIQRSAPPLATTWPVITEAMYLLGFASRAQDALLQMMERGALQLISIASTDISRIRTLMQKYRDLPMDLADATLVRAAERMRLRTIFTLDRRDFGIYRVDNRRPLRLLP
jgi:predicted nucleic acid-binding protein